MRLISAAHTTACFFLAVFQLLDVTGGVRALGQSNQGLELVSAARLPQSKVVPGGVLVLQATARNTADEWSEGVLVVTVDGRVHRQSARRIALAPGDTEQVDIYTSLPQSIAGKSTIEVKVTLFVDYGDGEVVQDSDGRPAEYTMTFSVLGSEPLAAFIMDQKPSPRPHWYWPPAQPHTSYELAVAGRIDAGLTRQTTNFDQRILPLNQADWSSIDVIVLSEAGAFNDAAFTDAIKKYVDGGGKVWVMLDRVPTDVVRPVLAPEQICETVDEVERTSFTVEQLGSAARLKEVDLQVTSATPYKLKHVVQSGGRVTHRIDGWPAAIWMKRGYGEILLTTLDCGAWIEPRANPSSDPRFSAAYTSRVWASLLAISINAAKANEPLPDLEYPLQQIGNPVVPKLWVTLTLAAFCALLAGLGVWRTVNGGLRLIGLAAPALAILVGAGLLLVSTVVSRDIPETIAKLQIVQVAQDGKSAMVREQAAVYLERSADMILESNLDGGAVVDESLTSGVQRFDVIDFQRWQLSNQTWPSGAWRYRTNYSFLTEDLVVCAKLAKDGVHLTMPALPSELQDPVLSFCVGDPIPCQSAGESLFLDGSLTAKGGRWIAGTILNDEQQRRLGAYQAYFESSDRGAMTGRTLYGWTKLWPQGPHWSRELRQRGSSLISLPLRLERPEPGQPIYIPHGLIQLQKNPDHFGSTTFAYDESSGEWEKGLTIGVEARLRVALPPEVLPFEASSIEIVLDIEAPHRNVSLACELPSGPVELIRLSNPSLPRPFTVSDPRVLRAVRNGALDIVLAVSDRTDVEDSATSSVVAWHVDSLAVSFHGQLVGPSAATAGNVP